MEKVLAAHRDLGAATEAIAAYLGRRGPGEVGPDDVAVGELLITEAVLALIGFRITSEQE